MSIIQIGSNGLNQSMEYYSTIKKVLLHLTNISILLHLPKTVSQQNAHLYERNKTNKQTNRNCHENTQVQNVPQEYLKL